MGKFNQNPVGGLIRKAQDQLEKRAGTLTDNESVLQQDRFWLKSVTWTLIGTTVFGIGWLGIARTEEVVVAMVGGNKSTTATMATRRRRRRSPGEGEIAMFSVKEEKKQERP